MRKKIDLYAFTIVNHDISLQRPLFVHHRNVLNQVLLETFKKTRFVDLALSGCVKGLPKQANRSNSQLLVVKPFESLRQNYPRKKRLRGITSKLRDQCNQCNGCDELHCTTGKHFES